MTAVVRRRPALYAGMGVAVLCVGAVLTLGLTSHDPGPGSPSVPMPVPQQRTRAMTAVGGLALEAPMEKLADDDAPAGLPVPSMDAVGGCGLGTYIKAIPCSSNVRGAACCRGLRPVFDARCACRPIPGVVMSHGGSSLTFLLDFIRCEYSDESGTAPVDYVARQHASCVDQSAWCAAKMHNIDVRLTAWDLGLVQMHDAHAGGWVHVHAADDGQENAAHVVCKALGFARANAYGRSAQAGKLDGRFTATKSLSCSADAVLTGKISDCEVRELAPGASCDGGVCTPLRVECSAWPNKLEGSGGGSQLCGRTAQQGAGVSKNQLSCGIGYPAGARIDTHTRVLGAAHAVCGTAGVNETRIRWPDGYHDDFQAYVVTRAADGTPEYARAYKERLPGKDLLTQAELNALKKRNVIDTFVAAHGGPATFEQQLSAHMAEMAATGGGGGQQGPTRWSWD